MNAPAVELARVVLQPRRARPFYGRHPWVYAGAISRVEGDPADGDAVAACTDNTLRVFDLLERAIPVHEGAASPLVRDDFPIPREILHRAGSMNSVRE